MEPENLLESADLARRNGDLEDAAALYEQILIGNRSSTQAAIGLGICLEKLGRIQQAVQYLARVASRPCDSAEVFESLGNCYFKLGHMEPAVRAFDRTLDLQPDNPHYRLLLAHALARTGGAEEAERHLRKALAVEPNMAAAYDLLAYLLPQVGRFEEAKECARKAAALDPENPAYAVRLVYAGKVTEEDEAYIDRLESLAETDLSTADRIRVEYGLGKALEDLKRYHGSLGHYIKANAAAGAQQNQSGQRFNRQTHQQEVDLLIKTYTKDKLEQAATTGSPNRTPVLIVGMMRSGTTLTEQILSSHPQVGGAGELDYWIAAGPRVFNASPEQLQTAANDYLRLLETTCPGKERVCDKMPQNFMSLGSIYSAFPNIRVIHCRRDPRDTCFSIFTIPFTHHPPFAYSLKNIAFTYAQYQRLMAHWRTVLPVENLLEIDYEGLVADQEGVSRKMIDFIGLEWDEACLSFEQNDRVVNTPSRWQVRQPIYKSSVARWERFEPWLTEEAEDWGDIREL